jgi:hypothetical protein
VWWLFEKCDGIGDVVGIADWEGEMGVLIDEGAGSTLVSHESFLAQYRAIPRRLLPMVIPTHLAELSLGPEREALTHWTIH